MLLFQIVVFLSPHPNVIFRTQIHNATFITPKLQLAKFYLYFHIPTWIYLQIWYSPLLWLDKIICKIKMLKTNHTLTCHQSLIQARLLGELTYELKNYILIRQGKKIFKDFELGVMWLKRCFRNINLLVRSWHEKVNWEIPGIVKVERDENWN